MVSEASNSSVTVSPNFARLVLSLLFDFSLTNVKVGVVVSTLTED